MRTGADDVNAAGADDASPARDERQVVGNEETGDRGDRAERGERGGRRSRRGGRRRRREPASSTTAGEFANGTGPGSPADNASFESASFDFDRRGDRPAAPSAFGNGPPVRPMPVFEPAASPAERPSPAAAAAGPDFRPEWTPTPPSDATREEPRSEP
jgi:hypothetical protein